MDEREFWRLVAEYLAMQQTSGGQNPGGDMPYNEIGGLGAMDGPVMDDWTDTGISGAGTGTGGNLESATRPYLPPPPSAGYIGGRPLTQESPGIAQAIASLAAAASQASANPQRVPGNVDIQTSMGFGGPLMDLAQGHDQYSRGEFNYIPTWDTPPNWHPPFSALDKVGFGSAQAINNVALDPGKSVPSPAVPSPPQGARAPQINPIQSGRLGAQQVVKNLSAPRGRSQGAMTRTAPSGQNYSYQGPKPPDSRPYSVPASRPSASNPAPKPSNPMPKVARTAVRTKR